MLMCMIIQSSPVKLHTFLGISIDFHGVGRGISWNQTIKDALQTNRQTDRQKDGKMDGD